MPTIPPLMHAGTGLARKPTVPVRPLTIPCEPRAASRERSSSRRSRAPEEEPQPPLPFRARPVGKGVRSPFVLERPTSELTVPEGPKLRTSDRSVEREAVQGSRNAHAEEPPEARAARARREAQWRLAQELTQLRAPPFFGRAQPAPAAPTAEDRAERKRRQACEQWAHAQAQAHERLFVFK